MIQKVKKMRKAATIDGWISGKKGHLVAPALVSPAPALVPSNDTDTNIDATIYTGKWQYPKERKWRYFYHGDSAYIFSSIHLLFSAN